jgi:hypothetical protein
LLTDISGQPIGTIFKGQEKMGQIGCPETSVRNDNYRLPNSQEERSSPKNWAVFMELKNAWAFELSGLKSLCNSLEAYIRGYSSILK